MDTIIAHEKVSGVLSWLYYNNKKIIKTCFANWIYRWHWRNGCDKNNILHLEDKVPDDLMKSVLKTLEYWKKRSEK